MTESSIMNILLQCLFDLITNVYHLNIIGGKGLCCGYFVGQRLRSLGTMDQTI